MLVVPSSFCTISKTVIWPRVTGQQIPCFDRCQLTITWRSNIKEVRCKLGIRCGWYVCSLVLVVVWLPCFALSSPCIGPARPKYELTNQDSVGEKNSTVLTSTDVS